MGGDRIMGKSQDKMMKYLKDLAKNNPGSPKVVAWYHDDWCPCGDGTHGLMDCICDPDPEVVDPSLWQRQDG